MSEWIKINHEEKGRCKTKPPVHEIVRFIMALVIAGIGVTLVWYNSNAWVVLGIVLMLWSNNIERSTFKD